MPDFKYKAMNRQGKKLEGRYRAKNESEVLYMLKANSYYPLSIEEVIEANTIDLGRFTKVKTKDIAIFCRQFYTMLNAGATIISCLDVLREQTQNKKLKKSLDAVYDEVQKGVTLSEAMRNHGEVFPSLLINMIESGEVSGNLDIIMSRMSVNYEKETKLNNKIRGAMVYPIILSGLTITIVIFLLTFIMPTFVSMFKDSGTELPALTQSVLNISNVFRGYWYVFFTLIAGITYGIGRYFKTPKGRILFDGWKLKIPLIKGLNQKIIVSRFTRTLSTVLSSGIPLVSALQVTAKVVENKVVENKILVVRDQAIKGVGLAEPIRKSGVFPTMLYSMINIGEESGTLDEILDKTADFYDEELETAIQTFTNALEPMMILVMGIMVGFIVIAMMLCPSLVIY